ncbi:hypothetical protein ETAA8_39800 [Anatilimnocola aggregata]|uniref:STAS/SEC14 domain-containing protein n=1 Tax=Anatilimnocola aggregata TaxID=2528021 RepID=A0A517YF66_9BACT|nr:hypothetical protein [Anatilimnocola aggregata]QDU28874.1 hypothetical protein ETAA8_39800 [Anatilimnocola aggregata]
MIEQDRALYRPLWTVSFDEAVTLVRAGIAAAMRHQVKDLLVDTTALRGFPSPGTFQRFLMAVEWAEEASGRIRLAMVALGEMIHAQKFGVTVAFNRGLVNNVFTTELEALAWLDVEPGKGSPTRRQ